MDVSALDLGDLPTWVAALSSLVALGAAIWAAASARALWTIEIRRDNRRDDQERQAQAKLVAVWPGQGQDWWEDGSQGFPFEAPAAIVRNSTDLPIYDVRVAPALDGNDPSAFWARQDVIPPGDSHLVFEYRQIGAQQVQIDDVEEYGPILTEWCRNGRITLQFRDASGRTWSRAADGTLTESDLLPEDARGAE